VENPMGDLLRRLETEKYDDGVILHFARLVWKPYIGCK